MDNPSKIMQALMPKKSYDEIVSQVMEFAREEDMSDAEASRLLKSQLKKYGFEPRETVRKAKAKGGKVPGYRYGTPKGGVRKMASCRGRKAMGNKD